MKRLILALLVISVVLLGACAAPSAPPEPEPTAPSPAPPEVTPPKEVPTYAATPLDNGIVIGDFSIALSRVDRVTYETDYTTLYFAIRRINATTDDGWLLKALSKVYVMDDHDNVYVTNWRRRVMLGWEASMDGIPFSSLPVGFTWLTAYNVKMPRAAPIEDIKILKEGEVVWEIDYPKYQLVSPDLDAELQEGIISLGETIAQGKYLQWSIGKMHSVDCSFYAGDKKIEKEWLIPFYVENLDYNPRELNLTIRFQLSDGTIKHSAHASWWGGYFYNSQEADPYRPAYSIQAGYIRQEIPGQSETWLTFYRIPVLPEEAGNKPAKILILNGGEGEKELYILKITPELFAP